MSVRSISSKGVSQVVFIIDCSMVNRVNFSLEVVIDYLLSSILPQSHQSHIQTYKTLVFLFSGTCWYWGYWCFSKTLF